MQVLYKEITICTRFIEHDLRPHLHANFIVSKSFTNRMILTRCITRFKHSFFSFGMPKHVKVLPSKWHQKQGYFFPQPFRSLPMHSVCREQNYQCIYRPRVKFFKYAPFGAPVHMITTKLDQT